MKRAPLYSSAVPRRAGPAEARAAAPPGEPPAEGAVPATRRQRVRAFARRHRLALLFPLGIVYALIPVLVYWALQSPPAELTQEDIDSAVLNTLENQSLPSRSAKAAEAVRESVVRVRGYLAEEPSINAAKKGRQPGRGRKKADTAKSAQAQPDAGKGAAAGAGKNPDKRKPGEGADPEDVAISTGSGVVILDKGVILTNMHVVEGAQRLTVTFYDGMESEAEVVGLFPENDLAVLQAKKIPDDLPAATLGASGRLKPGDEVVAVGFPFGIGPSVSSGVVSGLNREFRSAKGERVLTHLIQFDAAANSGNSGGPLVTMDGEVVGIVTAILNPGGAGTFIGIGFAVTIENAGMAVGVPPF